VVGVGRFSLELFELDGEVVVLFAEVEDGLRGCGEGGGSRTMVAGGGRGGGGSEGEGRDAFGSRRGDGRG